MTQNQWVSDFYGRGLPLYCRSWARLCRHTTSDSELIAMLVRPGDLQAQDVSLRRTRIFALLASKQAVAIQAQRKRPSALQPSSGYTTGRQKRRLLSQLRNSAEHSCDHRTC